MSRLKDCFDNVVEEGHIVVAGNSYFSWVDIYVVVGFTNKGIRIQDLGRGFRDIEKEYSIGANHDRKPERAWYIWSPGIDRRGMGGRLVVLPKSYLGHFTLKYYNKVLKKHNIRDPYEQSD